MCVPKEVEELMAVKSRANSRRTYLDQHKIDREFNGTNQ